MLVSSRRSGVRPHRRGILYLEITADGQTLTPRQRLLAVPYAIRSEMAETVADGSITSAKLGKARVRQGVMII